MTEKRTCSGERLGPVTGKPYPCDSVSTQKHEGRYYCDIHHPPSADLHRNIDARLKAEIDQQEAFQREERLAYAALAWMREHATESLEKLEAGL